MKKIVGVLAVVAVLFCGLWVHEIFDKSDTEKLCQMYASESCSAFKIHDMLKEQNKGSSAEFANYWSAVSKFYAFSETLRLIVGAETDLYKNCDTFYQYMLLDSENVLSHTNELLAAMNRLSKNYRDTEGHKIIADLNDLLQDGTYPK